MKTEQKQQLEAFFDELRHYLYCPEIEITYNRPLSLKNGQVLVIERDGYEFRRGTSGDTSMSLELCYLTTRYMCIVSPHTRHIMSSKNRTLMMTDAAVSEYCGARHNYRPSANEYHTYEAIRQQVFVNLRDIDARLNIQFTPLVQRHRNFFRLPDSKQEWIKCSIIAAILAPFLLYQSRAAVAPQAKFPWEYDYPNRYGKNPAYDTLGKTAKEYTALVRAFKDKNPEDFAYATDDSERRYAPIRRDLNAYSHIYTLNTDEAQRLLRANFNISRAAIRTEDRAKPGWLTINQAIAIVLREAKKP
jgi:hypothetical protein